MSRAQSAYSSLYDMTRRAEIGLAGLQADRIFGCPSEVHDLSDAEAGHSQGVRSLVAVGRLREEKESQPYCPRWLKSRCNSSPLLISLGGPSHGIAIELEAKSYTCHDR